MMGMPRFSRTRRIRASSRSSACFSYPPYCCVALMAATLALGLCAVAPNVTQAGEPPGPQDDARVRGGRTVEKSPPAEQSPYVKITTELGVLVLYVAPQAGRALDQQSPYSLWWRDDTTEQIYLYGRRVFDRSGLVRALISLEAEFGPDPLELAQAIGAVSFGDSQREFAGHDPLWLPATRENIFAVMEFPFPDGEDAEPVDPPARAYCPPCSATLPEGKPNGRNPRNASDDDRVAIELIAVPLPDLSLDDIIEIVILEACGCGGGGSDPCAGVVCDDENECTKDKCVGGECIVPVPPEPDGKKCTPDTDPCTDDICLSGECEHPATLTGPKCAPDEIPCTRDICVEGNCEHPLDRTGGDCESDGNACTNDTCDDGECIHTTLNCDDSNECTTDYCVPCWGCIHDHCCDDGDACTWDSCDLSAATPCDVCIYTDVFVTLDDQELCSTYGCAVTFTGSPSIVPLNDDDDDGNGIADYLDISELRPTNVENDLLPITINYSGCPAGQLFCELWEGLDPGVPHWQILPWSANPGSTGYDFQGLYQTQDGTVHLHGGNWSWDWEEWPAPNVFYIEGRSSSNQCGTIMYFTHFQDESSVNCYCAVRSQLQPIRTVKLSTVYWQLSSDTPPAGICTTIRDYAQNDPCPNNGGVRIFPGKKYPNDPNPANRRKINLVAQIVPPVAGVTVYIQVWDVDDPFDQLHGTQGLPENHVAAAFLVDPDNPTSGPDNRMNGQTDLAVGTYTATTDNYGIARLAVTVSMQPGNNYRAAASLLDDALGQVGQAEADALSVRTNSNGEFVTNGYFEGYQVPVHWSQMLTVWRKLHVEIDSMSAEPSTIAERSPDWDHVVIDAVTIDNTNLTSTLRVRGFTEQPITNQLAEVKPYHYEGGSLTVDVTGQILFVLESHSIIVGADNNVVGDIVVQGVLSAAEQTSVLGQWATLRDDDPIQGQLPLTFLLNQDQFIKDAYADAYIDIVELEAQYNIVKLVDFDLELSDLDLLLGVGWENEQNTVSADNYWAALLVFAFQPGQDSDADPDIYTGVANSGPPNSAQSSEDIVFAATPEDNENASAIFLETIRDMGHLASAPTDLVHTIAHEIGHSCGPNTPTADDHNEFGIMTPGAPAGENKFRGESLLRFRRHSKW